MSVQGMNHFTVLSDDLEVTRQVLLRPARVRGRRPAELPVPRLLAVGRRSADPARDPPQAAAGASRRGDRPYGVHCDRSAGHRREAREGQASSGNCGACRRKACAAGCGSCSSTTRMAARSSSTSTRTRRPRPATRRSQKSGFGSGRVGNLRASGGGLSSASAAQPQSSSGLVASAKSRRCVRPGRAIASPRRLAAHRQMNVFQQT